MHKIEAGHWQSGIYHVRKISGGWRVTVEDGKGFPFAPMTFRTLAKVQTWLGE